MRSIVEERAVGRLCSLRLNLIGVVVTAATAAILVAPAGSVLAKAGSVGHELGRGVVEPGVMGPGGVPQAARRDATTITATVTAATESPSTTPSTEPGVPDGHNSRVGGSDGAPEPAKPGWVWWVSGAFLVMLGAGGFRLWRSAAGSAVTETEEPEDSSMSDRTSDND